MARSLYELFPKDEKFRCDEGTVAPYDLYVYLTTSGQYLLLVQKNEKLSESKAKQFLQLWGKNLYIKKEDLKSMMAVPLAGPPSKLEDLDPNSVFQNDILGEAAEKSLKTSYLSLLGSTTQGSGFNSPDEMPDPTETLKDLADKILAALLPDVKSYRDAIVGQLKNVTYMNHASAITTIAVMVALANEFNSKTSLESLSRAIILMDASLAEIDDEILETYYRNPEELPTHVWEKIKTHPLKSQQLVAYLPVANEIVNQLILTHHELHNGKGYHRGIRSGGILLLGQVLSLAVDAYERFKMAHLNGDSSFNLEKVFESFKEKHLEPHSRRHPDKIVKNVFSYLGMKY